MAALSNFLENRLIDEILRGQNYVPPTNVFIALFTTNPTDAGTGTEVTGGSYARVSVAATLANWAGTQAPGSTVASNGTGGTTSNNVAITFTTPTASWGTVTHVAIFDALTGGNMLIHAPLVTPKVVNTGDTVSFAVGQLSFQIDD